MTDKPLEVQVFGFRKDAGTRKALRFFSERRIKTHFMDLSIRAASYGELQRFAQRFGVDAILDRDSRRFEELGLRTAILSPERWLAKLSDEPGMLKTPLVRNGNALTVGVSEQVWKGWLR